MAITRKHDIGRVNNKELRNSDEPIISSPDGQTSEAYINRGEFLQIHRQKLEYQMEFFYFVCLYH